MCVYSEILGMKLVNFGEGRVALHFGDQKINLHPISEEVELKASFPISEAADLCFLVENEIDDVIQHLMYYGIEIEDGPVERIGALGPMTSIYVRDPDFNLIELSKYH